MLQAMSQKIKQLSHKIEGQKYVGFRYNDIKIYLFIYFPLHYMAFSYPSCWLCFQPGFFHCFKNAMCFLVHVQKKTDPTSSRLSYFYSWTNNIYQNESLKVVDDHRNIKGIEIQNHRFCTGRSLFLNIVSQSCYISIFWHNSRMD